MQSLKERLAAALAAKKEASLPKVELKEILEEKKELTLIERIKLQRESLRKEEASREALLAAYSTSPTGNTSSNTPSATTSIETSNAKEQEETSNESNKTAALLEKFKTVIAEAQEDTQLNKDEVSIADLNERQRLAVTLGSSGKSFVLIGSAGSGKTTTQRVILQELIVSNKLGKFKENCGKHFTAGESYTGLITAFTKVATRNIKEAAPFSIKGNCINIHKVIEFEPTKVMIESTDESGQILFHESMRFTPARNRYNPLKEITLCIVEEAGSLDVDLFLQLADALPRDCVYIFLGDLNQLPPVYGAAILGFAINKLPVVELTEVYRQNIGAIKELASKILEGKRIPTPELLKIEASSREGAELKLVPFTNKQKVKRSEGIRLNRALGEFMQREVREGRFIPSESVVLTAVRKETQDFLTIHEINKHIAQALGEERKAEVFEIKSKSIGGGTHYYAVGDLVFYERNYYVISSIEANPKYSYNFGVDYQTESTTLNRWGLDTQFNMFSTDAEGVGAEDFESLLNAIDIGLGTSAEDAESKNQISHFLKLRSIEGEEDEGAVDFDASLQELGFSSGSDIKKGIRITTPSELSAMQLGYAQTIHSSQGSEWANVYLMCPDNIGFMLNREMLYTGITRARTSLTVFYEDGDRPHNFGKGTFDAAIKRQAIKGDTLKDKRKFFKALGEEKLVYQHIPKLLESLNNDGVLPIEDYYDLDDNNSLKFKDTTFNGKD